ncbi:hypothetical protein GW17_00057537 [Ensete ventricosum]|nr:hypothetical protein GW17_00057537 [Ensete ventricosum]
MLKLPTRRNFGPYCQAGKILAFLHATKEQSLPKSSPIPSGSVAFTLVGLKPTNAPISASHLPLVTSSTLILLVIPPPTFLRYRYLSPLSLSLLSVTAASVATRRYR